MTTNHQVWAPRKSGGGDRRRNVQLWATVWTSDACDLDLDLGSGQGHISMHNTCSTTSVPNRVTVASRCCKILPFGFCEISTFGEVWTLVINFLEGNSKIGLR